MDSVTGNIIELPSRNLCGIKEIGPSSFNPDNSGSDFGASLWRKLITAMTDANMQVQRSMYGVSWPADDKTPPDSVHYFVGFEKIEEALPGEFIEFTTEGGRYFCHKYVGPAAEVVKGFQDAYMKSFPESGLLGRVGQHLEVYPADLNMEAPEISFEILIPVE